MQVKGDNDANLIRTDAANDLVGIGKSAPAHKLDVDGVGSFESGIVSTGLITAATGIALQRNTPATTTDKLYNVGGALYFNGSAVDGDTTYTAGSGLTLVGTQFNTADTGNFTKITFGQGASAATDNLRIGHLAGDGASATNTSVVAIGPSAGKDLKDESRYGVNIGYGAGETSSGHYNNSIGFGAGAQQEGEKNVSIGYYCGWNSVGNANIFIGEEAGIQVDGSNNIEIVTDSTTSPLDNQSNKINVEYTIIGDTSAKKLAIGNVAGGDHSPDATLEIKPKEHTDIGLIVQGDTSHSANLTEWQNSAEGIRAYVAADGAIATSGTVSATGGMVIGGSSKLMWVDDDGDDNGVRIGQDAGIMGGKRNVSIGQYAGNGTGGGEYNVGIGRYACGSVGGDHNVGISYQAGKDSDGDYNISLGYQAGYQMSASSDYNICLGRNA